MKFARASKSKKIKMLREWKVEKMQQTANMKDTIEQENKEICQTPPPTRKKTR